MVYAAERASLTQFSVECRVSSVEYRVLSVYDSWSQCSGFMVYGAERASLTQFRVWELRPCGGASLTCASAGALPLTPVSIVSAAR
jgi:hypothetical protein